MIQSIRVTPNYSVQSIVFFANNQNFTLLLNWTGYINENTVTQTFLDSYAKPQFFASIYLNNEAIIKNTPIVNSKPINLYTSRINGYIVAVDISGANENPTLANIGVTVFFYYVSSLAEITNIAGGV
jgi:hypothetical protein